MKKSLAKFKSELGQTLIETLAALFILVMGVSAASGLAVYAFGTSTNINKQIIATGLAREGIEAVRNMRDTNWLNDILVDNGCYDFPTGNTTASCYQNWLGQTNNNDLFCINPVNNNGNSCNSAATGNAQTYSLGINIATNQPKALWNLQRQNTSGNNDGHYGMAFVPNNNNGSYSGFYIQDGSTDCGGGTNPADYCRKLIITNTGASGTAPYNIDANLSLLLVQSQIWWVDKKCPRVSDFSLANPSCRIELDGYLTNWKNY